MRVPLTWLRDYVPLPADPAALIERLTLAGLESSGVKVVGLPVPPGLRVKPEDQTPVWDRDKIVVARVLEITKHPDAEKLKLVKLDYGAAEPKTVVTGATNIAPGQSGMKVVLGLRGSRYFLTDKNGQKTVVTLEPRKLRGIDNDAMCMSNFELGISDEHEGIILLDESDPQPGTPLQDVLGEIIVELDVLPNMARCLSLIGIAREVAALTGATATIPEPQVETVAEAIDGNVQVTIADAQLCPRYTATLIRNVTVRPAPRWMQSRLISAGMRPINNIVDITNYVMLEWGQPLHAFDYDVLVQRAGGKPPTLCVRPAAPGEQLKTLDGQVRQLSPENLVIADTAGVIALAGVMGGAETEVTASTTTILLESAAFDFVSVRKTARQFNLFSEASTRFSRGVHPDLPKPAAIRAAELIRQFAGGQVLSGQIDNYPAPPPTQVVELHRSEIARLLGFDMPTDEVERVLRALQFTLKTEPFGWTVTVPRTRLDIQVGPADLIEELARVSGYDQLQERLLPLELPEPKGNRSLELEDRVRDLLADQGLQEAITYSLTSAEAEAKLQPHTASAIGDRVTLLNPISPERSVMRRTLLPELLTVVHENLKTVDAVAMYELGFVYLPQVGATLPHEPRRLAIVLCGRRTAAAWDDPQGSRPAQYDFFDIKGVVEGLAADLHLPEVRFRPAPPTAWLHPGRSAELVINQTAAGVFGELHPKVAANFGKEFADRAVQVAEFDLETILAAVPDRFPYRPFSTLPAAKRDVAVVVPASTAAERILAEIRAAGGELLVAAELFDVYTGEGIPPGTKSLAFALTYQAADHTLSDKEITKVHEKIEGRLRHVLKAQIRGKDC
jgi:phenylalanyl-tRNA synthetase beta chain